MFAPAEGVFDPIVVLLHAKVEASPLLVAPFPLGVVQLPPVETVELGAERGHTKECEDNRRGTCDRRAVHGLSFFLWYKEWEGTWANS